MEVKLDVEESAIDLTLAILPDLYSSDLYLKAAAEVSYILQSTELIKRALNGEFLISFDPDTENLVFIEVPEDQIENELARRAEIKSGISLLNE